MPAREVTLSEREAVLRRAEAVLALRANEWVTARASGDREQTAAAGLVLDGAARDYRRASSAQEKTAKRLARRALTTTEEDG